MNSVDMALAKSGLARFAPKIETIGLGNRAKSPREFPWIVPAFCLALLVHVSVAAILIETAPPAKQVLEMPVMALEMSLLPTVPAETSLPVQPPQEAGSTEQAPEVAPLPPETIPEIPVAESQSPDAQFKPQEQTPAVVEKEEKPTEETPPLEKKVNVPAKVIEPPKKEPKPDKKPERQPVKKKDVDTPAVAAVAPSGSKSNAAGEKKAAARVQGLSSNAKNDALTSWGAEVKSRLEKAKRFPAKARAKGQQDTIVLSLSIDRSGRILSGKILKSKGYVDLDNEALALVKRVGSVPPPPSNLAGQVIVRKVSLRFFL